MSIETPVLSSRDASLSSRIGAPAAILTEVSDDERARAREMKSFAFRHSLGRSPTMSLVEIRKLTQRMLDEKRFDQVFYRTKTSKSDDGACDASSVDDVLDALQSLNTAGAWLRLTRVDEVTEQFRETLEQFYSDLSALYRHDIRSRALKTFVTLFISSPGVVTPYHMDHTWNFLLQIYGRKTVHLFDPTDTKVLLPEDKEGWYARESFISPKPGAADIAYPLEPGDAVHHPVNAPHLVKNGPEVSISLSLGLCLHDSNRDAKVFQANYVLRKLGLNPTPPRTSEWRDASKALVLSALSDRSSSSFDEVVYSGISRLKRMMKTARLAQ